MLSASTIPGHSRRSTPSWKFHPSGFGSGVNAGMAVFGRPATIVPPAAAHVDACASPPDCEVGGGIGTGTNKRPLPTSREELERGWQRNMHRCVSNDASSSSSFSSSYFRGKDGSFPDDDDDDDDAMMGIECKGGNGRMDDPGDDYGVANKRRRMSSPHEIGGGEDEVMNAAEGCDDDEDYDDESRDGPSPPTATGTTTTVARHFVRIARCDPSRRDVKSGWYEGPLDAYGNRHGYGITRHDDGTEYEGQYVNDVMSGCHGRYSLAPYQKLVVANVPSADGAVGNGNDGLMRRIEASYVGSFRNDVPHGVGTTITRTVDYRANGHPMPWDVRGADWAQRRHHQDHHQQQRQQQHRSHPPGVRSVMVTYDIGVHDASRNGAVGEGVRIAYRSVSTIERLIDGGRTINTTAATWEKSCYRLMYGRDANMKVADEYAAWIVQCMGATFPGPPHGQAGWGEIG
jgi:hypothetical protein